MHATTATRERADPDHRRVHDRRRVSRERAAPRPRRARAAQAEPAEHARIRPAPVGSLDDRAHERAHARRSRPPRRARRDAASSGSRLLAQDPHAERRRRPGRPGTFTRNTQRQSSSTSRPPSGGPAAAATPPIAAQMAMATGRSLRRELGEQQPERAGKQQRASGGLDHAGGDQRLDARGGGAQRAAEHEDDAGRRVKTRLRPSASAQRPAGHHQRGEHDRVGAQHPAQRRRSTRRRTPPRCRGRRR